MSDQDPYTRPAQESGCSSCGKRSGVFWAVEYYILPRKLVRQRHRVKNTLKVFCRPGYESSPDFDFMVGGRMVRAAKKPMTTDTRGLSNCIACGGKCAAGLYGILTATWFMEGSMIENYLMGMLGAPCVEENVVELSPQGSSPSEAAGA